MNDQAHELQQALACLADPSRFRITRLLLERAHFVSELARAVGKSQSCTTRHLQALSRAGLVRGTRQGKRVVFEVVPGAPLTDWLAATGTPAGRAPAVAAATLASGLEAKLPRATEPAPAARQREELEDFLL